MSTGNLAGLVAANAVRAAQRAQGIRMKQPSRAKALRAYWREHFGLDHPQGSAKALLYQDYKAKLGEIRRMKSPVLAIETACFNCVGGDADPGPKLRVRDCACTDCSLHPIRAWQHLKGRGGSDKPPQESFLTGI